MQNVDNHMDDLFRKAADNYPLKTSNGDWETLQSLLENEPANVWIKVSKRKPFFLFVSIVFLLIGVMTFGVLKNNGVVIKIAVGRSKINSSVLGLPRNTAKSDDENTSKPDMALGMKKDEHNQLQKSSKTNLYRRNAGIFLPPSPHDKLLTNQPAIKREITVVSESKNNDSKSSHIKESNALTASVSPFGGGINDATVKTNTIYRIDTSIDKFFIQNKDTIKVALNRQSKSRVYFSISAGLEYNQVKNQGLTKPGWNAGLLAGVQLNNKISIETGLQLSQKKYFSSGLYFKPKSGSMPSDMVVNSLTGNSVLIELPVNLKYNLQKGNNTFYLVTGISSFLMTTESNHYFALISGAQTEMDSKYQQMHNYFASMINVAAGYQFALNKKNNLRVEPYLQIPIRGIGIGSMPVMATGLHFVWSRR